MTNEEYNDRLFSLIQRNADCPYKGLAVFDAKSTANSIGEWCKALIEVYQVHRRKAASMEPAPPYFTSVAPGVAEKIQEAFDATDKPPPLDYNDIVTVFKTELREFLERARDSSLASNDKSLCEFLLTCIEPPLQAESPDNDPLRDF